VILCGGLGTRMRPHTDTLPKPMVLCNGRPFLEYLILQLRDLGIRRFVLLTGYLAEQIESFFGDGSRMRVSIEYCQGPAKWETGRRLLEARGALDSRFLLLYSDNFVPFPLETVLDGHVLSGMALTLTVASKQPGNISMDDSGKVVRYDPLRSSGLCRHVEIGYMVAERDRVLAYFDRTDCSFSDVIGRATRGGEVGSWLQRDSYYSISDPERWRRAEDYLRPKKILLIDRDGVINRKAARGEYITRWEDFVWVPESRHAMIDLAQGGFRFVVITNQAGIARKALQPDEVERIHRNMTEALANDGVEILDVYVCPHHWDDGCDCRKPKPGMLHQASRDHLFRLDHTVFIGDDERDAQAARSAGCHPVLVETGQEDVVFREDDPNRIPIADLASVVRSRIASSVGLTGTLQ
jgi:histidinol-phosphate phosphatase family protein